MAFIPVYILILFFTIIIDYYVGIFLEKATKNRKSILICSLIANLGILGFFKYYNFIAANIASAFHFANVDIHPYYLSIILPIGLSFHTFQAMSYTIEIYRGNQKPERNFGIYALYVMFYPQLVAGPIERPQNLLHQFYEKHHIQFERIKEGLKKIVWGLFKKMVIADRVAYFVNLIYGDLHHYTGITLLLAVVLFPFQIYCDFSGYSDIALGSAQVMGFDLMRNFNLPFASKSVSDFWRRWHISLTTWFYDYLFNPIVIALRDLGKLAIIIGLFITFFLSGLWHGASWHYIAYGCINGCALIYEVYTLKKRKKLFAKLPPWLNNFTSHTLTIIFLFFSWVFFRAENMNDVFYLFSHIFRNISLSIAQTFEIVASRKFDFVVAIIFTLLLLYIEQWRSKKRPPSTIYKWLFYQMLVLAILFFGEFSLAQNFIYFQF